MTKRDPEAEALAVMDSCHHQLVHGHQVCDACRRKAITTALHAARPSATPADAQHVHGSGCIYTYPDCEPQPTDAPDEPNGI